MKLDNRMVTGLALGAVIALHYHGILITYLPLLTVATLILVLNLIRH